MNWEKFVFKKISIWIVMLILIFGFIITITFGALVHYRAKGGDRFKFTASIIDRLIALPIYTLKIFKPDINGLALEQKSYKNLSGLNLYKKNTDGYLLLSKIDENYEKPKVDLINIKKNKIIHTWKFNPLNDDNYKSRLNKYFLENTSPVYQMKHPFLFENGDLLFKNQDGPLVLIDKCSKIKWVKNGFYHHSIEMDHNGDLWVNSRIKSNNILEDAIEKISKNGETKFKKSVNKILQENNLQNLIVTAKDPDDPIHINDIQPSLIDGPFWKKGDLFLSLRNLSMIMLYRPVTNKVLWYQQGPWVYQHDVDIINQNKISIYNDNLDLSKTEVNGTNETLIYDFSNNKITNPYKKAFEINQVKTPAAGLSQILNNGEIFVEETLNGRILRMNKNGKVVWEYINRSQNNKIYFLSWSRFLQNAQTTKPILDNLSKSCQ